MNGRILINKNNLINNLSEIKKLSPKSKVMSMIKSNAYGHGMLEVANLLSKSDAFAVATIEEAKYLRDNNIAKEIVCLQGFSNSDEYIYCSKNNIRPVIHDMYQMNIIENTNLSKKIKLWIKIDTGMNRLGFHNSIFKKVFDKCKDNKNIEQPLGIMTHLACADEDEDNFSDKQISLLENIVSDINIELSIFNSAGIIKYSKKFENSQHWIRPGLILYGINPLSSCDEINVKPVMNLLAPIISIKKCKKGDFVGYGQTYKIKNDTNVAAVGIGYGDGFPRRLSNIGKVFSKGNIFNIIGRVSMDIIMIDIRDKDIKIGSDVELWGENISIKDVSCSVDAIPYELMCSLGNRLSKEYI